jgi:hypothetical protein
MFAELYGERQADVAKTDDADFAIAQTELRHVEKRMADSGSYWRQGCHMKRPKTET